jgi:acyl carrier protein
MSDIRQAIRAFIVKEVNPDVPIGDDTPLVQQGIIDSLAIFMLIGFINDRFAVRVEPDEVSLDNFETIAAIEALVISARTGVPDRAAGA